MTEADDLSSLDVAVRAALGGPPWKHPLTYPGSLGLCILDSIWSMGVRYQGVVNVIDGYRKIRREAGASADSDSPDDLIEAIDALGGPASFADAVSNHQLTSSRSGIPKSDAVRREAVVVSAAGITTVADLTSLDVSQLDDVRTRWKAIPGQRSGISFTYFTMLAGVPDVKPDRMICAFVSNALRRPAEATEARSLLTQLHAQRYPGESLLSLDYSIWDYERGRPRPSRARSN